MPYIEVEKRRNYYQSLRTITQKLSELDDNEVKGHLNYIISTLIKRQLDKRGFRYFRAQDLIGGVLTCSQMELYRRFLAPYEDRAKEKNGDI